MYRCCVLTFLLGLILNTFMCLCYTPGDAIREDIYWREYDGFIPRDAVKGGIDVEGRPTYIGKIFYQNFMKKVEVGEVNEHTKTLSYVEMGVAPTTKEKIKILCATNPDVYQWVDYTTLGTPLLAQPNIVFGGHYIHNPYLIGRKHTNGRMIVGRVYVTSDFYTWLVYSTSDTTFEYEKTNFQLLLHKPQPPKECQPYGIDVRMDQ